MPKNRTALQISTYVCPCGNEKRWTEEGFSVTSKSSCPGATGFLICAWPGMLIRGSVADGHGRLLGFECLCKEKSDPSQISVFLFNIDIV